MTSGFEELEESYKYMVENVGTLKEQGVEEHLNQLLYGDILLQLFLNCEPQIVDND